MANAWTRLLAPAIVLAIAGALATSGPAAGADRPFTLFGNATDGWGSTNTSLSNPGPTITVDQGDNVSLTLNATDTQQHNWFADYDGNGARTGAEPSSPNFRDTAEVWNFTADTAGTFTYYCRFHPGTMNGTIVVRSSSGTPGGISDTSLYIVVGIVVGFVAVLAILTLVMRQRKGKSPE